MTLSRDNERVLITLMQFRILVLLVSNHGRPFTLDKIWEKLGGDDLNSEASHYRGYIPKIRGILGDDGCIVVNVRGMGYEFAWPVDMSDETRALVGGIEVKPRIVQSPLSKTEARSEPRSDDPNLKELETVSLLDGGRPSSPPPPRHLIGLRHLGQVDKEMLSRDAEAQELLDKLNTETRIVSVVSPAGFGKTALLVRAIQKALVGDDLHKLNASDDERSGLVVRAGLKGIAVLDARDAQNAPLRLEHFATVLNEMLGRQSTDAVGTDENIRRAAFFDLLSRAGRLWIIVENAESAFGKAVTSELSSLLVAWCAGSHQAKLILVTRDAQHPPPECHGALPGVDAALKDGLPDDAAVKLLRRNLKNTRFAETEEPLLREIAIGRLHRMPIAIEAFAGYLAYKEEEIITLDRQFVEDNDPLRLFHKDEEQMGRRFFFKIIEEQLAMMDPVSRLLLHVVAWAQMNVPQGGLVAVKEAFGSNDEASITRLVKSNLLVRMDGTPTEGTSFAMHALIREGLRDVSNDLSMSPVALENVSRAMCRAGFNFVDRAQFRPALAVFTLWERGVRDLVERKGRVDLEAELCNANLNLGVALSRQGLHLEALKNDIHAVERCRALVEEKGRVDLEADLAKAIQRRGTSFFNRGLYAEALKDHSEAIKRCQALVEENGRFDLEGELCSAILNRAIVFSRLRLYEEAFRDDVDAVERYRVLVEEKGRVDLEYPWAAAIHHRGSVFDRQGFHAEALRDYSEAINRCGALIEKKGQIEREGELCGAILNRGVSFARQGLYAEALSDFDDAAERFRILVEKKGRVDLEKGWVSVLVNRGVLFAMQGLYAEALSDLDDAVGRFRMLVEEKGRIDLEGDWASAYYQLALTLEHTRAVPAALHAARKAHRLYRSMVDRGLNHALDGLADADVLEHNIAAVIEDLFEQEFHPDHGRFQKLDLRRRVYAAVKSSSDSGDVEGTLAKIIYGDQFTDDERREVLGHFTAACSGRQNS